MTSEEWLKKLENEKIDLEKSEFWKLLMGWVMDRVMVNKSVCHTRDLEDQKAVASVSRAQGMLQFVEDFFQVQRRIIKKGSAKQ